MARPTWDDYFISIAERVAARSTCPRASVGAVITKDKRIIATGYNGSMPGEGHCTEIGCLMVDNHCERTVHAETNAVIQAAKCGVSIEGATLYLWGIRHEGNPEDIGKPVPSCIKCAQIVRAAGIVRVVTGGTV